MSGSQFISNNIFDILEYGSTGSEKSNTSSCIKPVEKVFEKRTTALAVLADKNTLEKCLTRTKICNSTENGYPCPYKDKCRFAHSIDELVITECLFGNDCRYVYKNNFKWWNKEGKKVCFHRHPYEIDNDYFIRTGAKKQEEVSFKMEEKKSNVTNITISNIDDLKNKISDAIRQGSSEIYINVV
jgi:hypothetical protein